MVVMQNVERPRMVSENGTTTTLKSGIQLKINSLRQDSFRQETFPDSSVGKESVCNARESGSIPGSGRFAGEGRGYPLQYSWVSLVAQLVRIHLQCRRPRFDSWVWKIHWRRDRLPTPVFLGFPGGPAGKESACNAGDPSSIPGLGRSAGEGIGYPLQYSWASLVP